MFTFGLIALLGTAQADTPKKKTEKTEESKTSKKSSDSKSSTKSKSPAKPSSKRLRTKFKFKASQNQCQRRLCQDHSEETTTEANIANVTTEAYW